MITLAVSLLAGVSAVSLAGAGLALSRDRREARRARARALSDGPAEEPAAPAGAPGRVADSVGRLGVRVGGARASASLRQQLAHAGFHDPAAAAVYLGAKAALFLLGALGTAAAALALGATVPGALFGAAMAGALLSFLPNTVVSLRRARRRRDMTQHLPDAVDLLEICVSAGMGLDAAWGAVSDEVRGVSPTLADEMELTTLEINLGTPRAEAMRHMAARSGLDDLGSLVALLVQSERLGASISDALTTFARSLREQRGQRAEESAEKMSVKLMFPMVIFIFPSLLLVMVGPAVLELVKVLGSR